VIGPNGAGKSTFFKLLTGEHMPSDGEIIFLGKSIHHEQPFQRIRQGMSIKFQIPGIFPELTVHQHLELSLYQTRNNSQAKIDELIDRFKLSSDAYRL